MSAGNNERRRARVGLCVVAITVGACGVGSGSDIGPRLEPLPDASCKVVVLDDQGRGVVSAFVRVGAVQALTGRNGRGDLLASPRGRQLVGVDARDGAAVDADNLAAYQVAVTINGPDLPAVLYVPNLPDTASAVVTLGTQATTTVVTSTAGAIVTIPTGSSVGTTGASPSIVTVRVGDLGAGHLPGDLPAPASGARLFGAGVWIDPAGLTCAPGATLDVADDLGIGSGAARLFRLGATTGEWSELAPGTAAGGRIVATGVIDTGGLYAFGVDVAATTRVTGRIVDVAGLVVADAMVNVDHLRTISDRDGNFAVDGVAATTAAAAPRSAVVEWFAGGVCLPARGTSTVPLAVPTTAAGDLALDTILAGNVRVLQVERGLAQAFRPARISSLLGDVALTTTLDVDGAAVFEDVPAEYFGFQEGRAIDEIYVHYGTAIGFQDRGQRWTDSFQFLQERAWYQGGSQSRTYVSDALGGGPVEGAAVVAGQVPGENFAGLTEEGGTVFVGRDFSGRATASVRTARDGKELVHAFSIGVPNGEHVELPLQRLHRAPLGAFERHGLIAGTLTGVDVAASHELRAARRAQVQDWWDQVVDAVPSGAVLPLDIDPAVTHGIFTTGLPIAGGHVAAIEFTSPGGLKTLQKVGVLADLTPNEGQRLARDLDLANAATEAFVLPGVPGTAEPELDMAQLTLALALQQPSRRIVDIARGLRGNHALVGSDLTFTLPPLTGALADHGWLALLDGSYPSNGTTVRCSALLSLPRGAPLASFPVGAPNFGSFPEVLSPAPGATVPAAGFTVEYSIPAGAIHASIELRSDVGNDTRWWQAIVPTDSTQFLFVQLPPEAVSPLIAGRTWTLTVGAHFGDGAVTGSEDPYRDLATFAQSIGAIERGVSTVMRRSITIVTN